MTPPVVTITNPQNTIYSVKRLIGRKFSDPIVQKDKGLLSYEIKEGAANKLISDFLIRSYPDYHTQTFQHKMFKSPEFCAACHKFRSDLHWMRVWRDVEGKANWGDLSWHFSNFLSRMESESI